MALKSERAIRRALDDLEQRLTSQLHEILESEKGFGGQRHSLRFVLGLPHKLFHRVADWERWR